jgi:hypothetical protein
MPWCSLVVPPAGIEPARLSALDFESSASTNSATEACCVRAGANLSTCDGELTSVSVPAGRIIVFTCAKALPGGGMPDEK